MRKAESICTFAGKEREVTQIASVFPLLSHHPPIFFSYTVLQYDNKKKIYSRIQEAGKLARVSFQQG